LIQQHVSTGIQVRIIDQSKYIAQFSSDDLKDMLIVTISYQVL